MTLILLLYRQRELNRTVIRRGVLRENRSVAITTPGVTTRNITIIAIELCEKLQFTQVEFIVARNMCTYE